jgi:hypothetical protein
MHIRSHYNIKEMVVDGLDLFNQRLKEINAEYLLKDEPDVIKDNYNVCIASKKSLKPKDDYPPLSLMSSVKEMKYIHYALCCFSSAFVRQGQSKVAAEVIPKPIQASPAVNSAPAPEINKQ